MYPYRKVLLIFLLSLILAGMSLTPLIIENVALPLEEKNLVYGPLFPLYSLFFAGMTVLVFFRLFRQLRLSRGLVRYQLRFFIGGILAALVMGSLANLFLPFIGAMAIDLRSLGPLSTIVMIGSISYAIVKYRLMDIRLALGKVASYVLAIVIVTTIGISPLLLFEQSLGLDSGSFYLHYMVFLIIIMAILFQPLRIKCQSVVDRYYYRGAYDYFDTLIKSNRAMASILHRDELLRFIVNRVVETVYLTGAVFFLKGPDGAFRAVAERHLQEYPAAGSENGTVVPGDALLAHLERQGEVLLFTDLRGLRPREEGERLEAQMAELRAEAAIPIIMEGRLEGVFFLGAKMSGELYSSEDVKLLSTLAFQLTVSLKNAQLYQEVLVIKSYLENVLENMGNGLIAVDSQGRITTFNSAAERLTGRRSRSVLGNKPEETLDPGLARFLRRTLQRGLGASEVEVELVVDGQTRFLCYSTALIELPETRERGAILVLSDVTRIKELEKEKGQIERLAALGEVAAGIAHEIKNPLVSIKTFAELLPEKYDDPEFRHSFSRIASLEIERINNLVSELLTFSRTQLSCEEVNVPALLDEIILLLSPQLGAQKIQLQKRYDAESLLVWADRNQLKQAILNVCLNSVQAMPNGGKLKLGVSAVFAPGAQMIGADSSGGKIRVVVEDTGVGISVQEEDRIFDPFFTTKSEGMGIGLSISHKVITEHGGTIQFRSGVGKGTVFEISLPAAVCRQAAAVLTGR